MSLNRALRDKVLCSKVLPVLQSELLALSRSCDPSPAEVSRWLAALQAHYRADLLASLGIPVWTQRRGEQTPTVRACTARLIWQLWSMTFRPSNLSSLFHIATWGRFVEEPSEQDRKELMLKTLHRRTGPAIKHNHYCAPEKTQPIDAYRFASASMAAKKRRMKGRPWKGYLLPGSGVPMLVG